MKKYETEFNLEVVKSFLAGEGGAKLLARRWSAPEEKVRTWVSHYRLHCIDGFRRITVALCNSMAEPVNHKCVQRLMQEMGLRALIRVKK